MLLNILVAIFFFFQKLFCYFLPEIFLFLLREILWSVSLPRVSQGLEEMAEAGGVRQHFNICRRAHSISTHKIPKMSNHKKSILNSSHKIPKNMYNFIMLYQQKAKILNPQLKIKFPAKYKKKLPTKYQN